MANHCTYPKELSGTSPEHLTPIEWNNRMNASIEWIMQVVYFISLIEILIESDPYSNRYMNWTTQIIHYHQMHISKAQFIQTEYRHVWIRSIIKTE